MNNKDMPANPIFNSEGFTSTEIIGSHFNGLTKLEYFTAKAMQGLSANPEANGVVPDLAQGAVQLAKATLKELEAHNEIS